MWQAFSSINQTGWKKTGQEKCRAVLRVSEFINSYTTTGSLADNTRRKRDYGTIGLVQNGSAHKFSD